MWIIVQKQSILSLGCFQSNFSSTPVQYGSSDVLRTSVTFSYERYIAGKETSLAFNKKKSENILKATV